MFKENEQVIIRIKDRIDNILLLIKILPYMTQMLAAITTQYIDIWN